MGEDKSLLNSNVERLSKELEASVKTIQGEIFDLAKIEFNIASPKQLGEVLFEHLKIDDKAKKTKTG